VTATPALTAMEKRFDDQWHKGVSTSATALHTHFGVRSASPRLDKEEGDASHLRYGSNGRRRKKTNNQGSVVCPPSYVVDASDLHSVHANNHMLKYEDDDTNLLFGSSNIATLAAERGQPTTTLGSTPRRPASWSTIETSQALTHWAPPPLRVLNGWGQ